MAYDSAPIARRLRKDHLTYFIYHYLNLNKMNAKAKKFFTEDWTAVWIGFLVIAVAALAVLTGWFDFSAAKFGTWTVAAAENGGSKAAPYRRSDR